MTLLWIFVLSDCFYQSWPKNLMTLLLLLGEDKRNLHCFTLWPATMLLKRIPLFDPRLTLSSFLMDSSRYTSNTTSIRKFSAPVHGADMKMASESSAKVLLLPWTLWTRLIPSMMQVDGCSIASANDTFFPAVRPVWTCLSFSACHHNYLATMAMVQVDGSALISCPPSCLLQWVPYGQTTCGLLSGQSPCWYI